MNATFLFYENFSIAGELNAAAEEEKEACCPKAAQIVRAQEKERKGRESTQESREKALMPTFYFFGFNKVVLKLFSLAWYQWFPLISRKLKGVLVNHKNCA